MGVRLLLAGRYQGSAGALSSPARPLPWLRSVHRWVEEAAGDLLVSSRLGSDGGGHPLLAVRLHPAGGDVAIVAAGEARVVVAAETSTVGPGYHRYLCDLLRHLGVVFSVDWMHPDVTGQVGDPTGYFHGGDAAAVREHMLGWLERAAAQALRAHEAEQGQVTLSMRFGHSFEREGAVLTPLGPRDEAWLRRVAREGRAGADVFPWWELEQGPASRLGRALCLMWTEVVWRPPLLEEERRRLRQVAHLLEQAWRADPSLAYPWREWHEVLAYLGIGGTLAEEVSRHALAAPDGGERIGYRRGDVRVTLPEGWQLREAGSFAEERLPDGSWVGRDHRRTVRLMPLPDGERPSVLPWDGVHGEEFEHRGERVRSRALLQAGEEGGRLTAVCDAGFAHALLLVQYNDPDDAEWALSTWRSVDFRDRA